VSADPAAVESPAPAAAPDAAPAAPHRAARRSLLFWGAALVILCLDLWTKSLVFERLGVDPSRYRTIREFQDEGPRVKLDVLGDKVRFVATLNPGMMWGAFDNHPALLKVVRPLAVLVIFLLLSSIPATQWSARLALGGILGGALGNIFDSFRYIGVRDFLEVNLRNVPVFSPFPAFNLADSAICVGVAVLALGMMRSPKETPEAAPPPQATTV
jgi:signal peptidase II